MRFFVTGVGGQLGHDVMNELSGRGHEGVGSDIAPSYSGIADGTPVTTMPYVQLDITDKEAVAKTIREVKPDAVVHCAAWTAVDAAEDEENREKVRLVNVVGTQNIADICKELGIKMMYISTDYVFDGQGTTPWDPDCKDNGKNFIRTMVNLGKTHDKLTVVSDQIGTPTYTYDLARLLVDMVETEKYGYYHATNEGGFISWYDFTKEIFRQAAALGHKEYEKVEVSPVTTAEYGVSKAVRPFNSRLDKSKLVKNGFQPLPTWQDALERYLKEIL